MTKIVIASSRNWFSKHKKSDEFKKLTVFEIKRKEELTIEKLKKCKPRYIFFPHWNWKVENEILEEFECIAFHTAPLPYGRGGSPIQNLIIRGFNHSPVCSLRMTEELDSGPIYTMEDISLDGSIKDIFERVAVCVEKAILKIVKYNPEPISQKGVVKIFKRLNKKDNELKKDNSINQIYDQIRMVDGEGYQKAFINFGNYKIEFSEAELRNKTLTSKIKLFKDDNKPNN